MLSRFELDVRAYADVWVDFDPDADHMIPVESVPELVLELAPPMGVRGKTIEESLRRCMALQLATPDARQGGVAEVGFKELLDALIKLNIFS